MEREVSGYYHDGKKLLILYKDEYGNETMEEWKDESETQNRSKEAIRSRNRGR